MEILEVQSAAENMLFLDVARELYKDDEVWVCPLDKDLTSVFDSGENPYFSHGEASRWILKDDADNLIGRVAAFIDTHTSNDNDQLTGGMGFFECVDNQDAANLLFDTAKQWLQNRKIEAMDGPINFGETDKFWGLLVDGFTHPAYRIAYNHPYYQKLFETYGFQIYYKQEGFHLNLEKDIPTRFWKIAEWVTKKPEYTFEHLDFSNIEKYVNDFTTVFNEAWKDLKDDFEPMKVEYVRGFLKGAKVILEEKFVWFAYYKGRPVGIYFMYPDVNQVFKGFKGKLGLWNKLNLLYKVKTNYMTRARGVLMGVVPDFQGKGIESAFIWHLNKAFKEMPQYKEIEFSWVGDFNPPMRKLWSFVGATSEKQYVTYRYLFDRSALFKRYPIPE